MIHIGPSCLLGVLGVVRSEVRLGWSSRKLRGFKVGFRAASSWILWLMFRHDRQLKPPGLCGALGVESRVCHDVGTASAGWTLRAH